MLTLFVNKSMVLVREFLISHMPFLSVGNSIQIMMDLNFEQPGFELHLTSISVENLARCCRREKEKTASMLHFLVALCVVQASVGG